MREILFRGKDKSSGEWVYGSYVHYAKRGVAEHCILSEGKQMLSIIPETVGQYTGENDKNGERIFEGDIVSQEDIASNCENTKPPYIRFSFAQFVLRDTESVHSALWFFAPMNRIKVIGNIHDNPELAIKE